MLQYLLPTSNMSHGYILRSDYFVLICSKSKLKWNREQKPIRIL